MTALSISAPFPIFTDIDGQPLEAGYIFIGVANLAPIGNPINVYWDAALTLPAAQPIRTIGGYPVNAGTPARLYVNSDYSIQVQNRNGSVVYSAPAATERLSGVVIEIDSTDVSFIQAGAGAVTRTAQAKMREIVSVLDFGADPTGATNSAAAIQAALAAASHVVVPPGTYRCDSMVELNANKTLELFGGATLKRFSANSASTDPVVWIKGSGSSFFGAGQAASTVVTENRSPKGVVRLGHKDMTESHDNVTYCTLKDMTISGSTAYGQTTGSPDVALYMPNPQLGGLASYFHNIFGLRVQAANYGIWLHGWANANTISNIQGYQLGNTTLGVNTNAFIFCNGALDNTVSNTFFHQSANSIGLLVSDFDNTATPGGTLHQPYANSFRGCVFEQGGVSALGLKALSGGGSFYEVRDNVAGGNSLFAGFYTNNVLFNVVNNMTFDDLNVTDDLVVGDTVSAARVLVAGAASDGYSKVIVPGPVKIGVSSQNSYNGTGTQTVTARFGTTLSGAVWRNAIIEIVFHGITAGAANEEYARYYIPIAGVSAWAIGTPVKVYGATLTITQTASTSSSVSFTVAGGSGSQIVSIYALGTAQGGLVFE